MVIAALHVIRPKLSYHTGAVNPIAAPSVRIYARRMTDHRNEEQEAARRELEKLRREGDALGGIFTRWFAPRAADANDPIDVWGTRIGRSLSMAALIVVCMYLVWIYLR
jgi:hypothetical protein